MTSIKPFQQRLGLYLFLCLLLSSCYNAPTPVVISTSPAEWSDLPPPTPPTTLPELIDVLLGPNAEARIGAAITLGNMGPSAVEAVPALTQNLYYRNSEVRRYAARALGNLGSSAEPAIPGLIVILLSDSAVQPRREVAKALGKIGDISAIPALAQCLSDEDEGVGIECAKSIAVLAGQQFPDLNSPGYSLDEKGVPLIVIAAREWWQKEGQHKSWVSLNANTPESVAGPTFTP